MHLLNIGKLQYALFDMKQIWFINALQLIIYCIATTLISSDCTIAGNIMKLFELFFCILAQSQKSDSLVQLGYFFQKVF